MLKTVFVTGGTGFIGSHLVVLLRRNGYRVRMLVRKKCNLDVLGDRNIEIIVGDIADRSSYESRLFGVDCVFHLAGIVTDWANKDDYYSTHVTGMKNLLSACKKNAIKRIIYLSTLDVVEKKKDNTGGCVLLDNFRYNKSKVPYIRTKVIAEKILFERSSDYYVTAFRPVWVYGRGDNIFIREIINNMKSRKMIYIANPKNRLSLVHVDNLVKIMVDSIENEKSFGKAFLICDGEMSWRKLLDEISNICGLRKVKIIIPKRVAYVMGFICEIIWKLLKLKSRPLLARAMVEMVSDDTLAVPKNAIKYLSYHPKISIKIGITDAIKWAYNKSK